MSNAQLKQTKNYNRKKNRREKRPKTETYNEKKTNMVDVNPIISIITLNVNALICHLKYRDCHLWIPMGEGRVG